MYSLWGEESEFLPSWNLPKQMKCEKKQILAGYRDCHTFLKEEFEAAGTLYISTEDGSVGTKGNVMDAIRENDLKADMIFACGPYPNAPCHQKLCRSKWH